MRKIDTSDAEVLNSLLIAMGAAGFVLTYITLGKFVFECYTDQSNLLMMITSGFFLYYLRMEKEIPKWLRILRYMAVLNLVVTFLVVLFVLIPMNNFDFGYCLFYRSMVFHHTSIPILSLFMFLKIDRIGNEPLSKKESALALLWTIFYAVFVITMNIIRVLDGPYPFVQVYHQPVWATVLWIAGIILVTFGISNLIRVVRNRIRN